jgi:lipoyl-dependent peroxiredoxin
MSIAQRTAEVVWTGSLAHGRGVLGANSGAFEGLPVTWAARTVTADGATSPEELIAAAHATCFTMALALVLAKAGTSPERLATSAECVLNDVDGAPRITKTVLNVRAHVEGLEATAFADAVEKAALVCPVSNALQGNVEISINALLEGSA